MSGPVQAYRPVGNNSGLTQKKLPPVPQKLYSEKILTEKEIFSQLAKVTLAEQNLARIEKKEEKNQARLESANQMSREAAELRAKADARIAAAQAERRRLEQQEAELNKKEAENNRRGLEVDAKLAKIAQEQVVLAIRKDNAAKKIESGQQKQASAQQKITSANDKLKQLIDSKINQLKKLLNYFEVKKINNEVTKDLKILIEKAEKLKEDTSKVSFNQIKDFEKEFNDLCTKCKQVLT